MTAISDAITGLSPSHYWKMDSAAGDLTLPDSVGAYNLTSLVNEGGGAAGPEPGTTAQRLYSDQIWTSPAFGLAGWTTHTWLLFFTVQANGAPTAFTDFLGFGDPSNRTASGFRAQFQSTASQNASFRVQGTGNQSLSSSAPWPQTNWHYFAWTVSATGGVQVAIDGVTFSTVSSGIGTAPLSTDRLWIQSAAPMVICHLAFVPSVLNSTALAGVTAAIPIWPSGQIPNMPGTGTGGGGGGLTEDQADQLTAIDTKTDALPGITDAVNFISDTVNHIKGVTDDTATKVAGLVTDVGNIVNTLFPQLADVLNDIGTAVNDVQNAVRGQVKQGADWLTKTVGELLSRGNATDLNYASLSGGATCSPINVDVSGNHLYGIRLEITAYPPEWQFRTPDRAWSLKDLAVIRVYRGGKLEARQGVHTIVHTWEPIPQPGYPWLGIFPPVQTAGTIVTVDFADGVCGNLIGEEFPS